MIGFVCGGRWEGVEREREGQTRRGDVFCCDGSLKKDVLKYKSPESSGSVHLGA